MQVKVVNDCLIRNHENHEVLAPRKLLAIQYLVTYMHIIIHVYTVDSRYSGSLKYGHLDIPAIWLGTEC